MVEIMVAATVLVISVGASVLSQMTARKLARTAAETSLAVDEINAAMEELLSNSRSDIVDEDGAYAQGTPIGAYTNRSLAGEIVIPAYPNYVPGDPPPDVLDVRLTISWTTFDGRQRSLILRSSTTR